MSAENGMGWEGWIGEAAGLLPSLGVRLSKPSGESELLHD